MVAAEKAGIPAVAIAARSFARAWQACVDGWGQPNTAFVTIPHSEGVARRRLEASAVRSARSAFSI